MMDNSESKKLRELEAELRLYKQEVRGANQALKALLIDLADEMKLAVLIQQKLTPTSIPQFPDFQISSKFIAGQDSGGDYFDFFQGPNKMSCGVVLSSSSNYSMSALFLSVLIKLSGFLQAKKSSQPEQALKTIAQEMAPQMKEKDEVHLSFLAFDRKSFELSVCTVGRLLCFHQPQKNRQLELIEAAAGPLQFNSELKVRSKKLILEAGDRVILFSPPFELPPSLIKKFEAIKAYTPHEFRNEWIHLLESHQKSQEFKKDLTLIVMEVKNRVIKLAKREPSV